MPGSRAGGLKTAARLKAERGDDYFKKIGQLGGKLGKTGGFADGEAGRARASRAGTIGGAVGRKNTTVPLEIRRKAVREKGYYSPNDRTYSANQ